LVSKKGVDVLFRIHFGICSFLFFTLSAVAQVNSGSLGGYVLDPSDGSVPNATVSIEDVGRAQKRFVRTDASGHYEFADLSPAQYRLTVIATGFAPLTTQPVRVEVDQRGRLDLKVVIAGRSDKIAVDAPVSPLSTESGELGAVLGSDLMQDLPLNERDFLSLALLIPGVAPPVENSELSRRGTFAMHANGGREESNNFLLDGADNNDSDNGSYVLQPSVDAIQEFKIASNSYSAEYGRASAGQVNVITRGGTNKLAGSAFEYLRNGDLDARNFFDGSAKPHYDRNQFGAGVGGPIRKDKLFFYANVESLREYQGLTQLGTVPTLAVRSGDLSSLGVSVVDPYTGTPFAGAMIPASRISPQAANILKLFPSPNLPGASGNYLSNPVGSNEQLQGTGRADYHISDSASLTVRYSAGSRNLFEPFAENQVELPGFGDYVRDGGHNALITYTRTFGPSAANSVTAAFNRAVRKILAQNDTTDVSKLWNASWLPGVPRDFGYPGIAVTGYSRVGDVASLPIDRADNTYQLGDNFSLQRGAHSLQMGAEIRQLQLNGYVEVYSRGQLSFTGALSNSGIGDLLLGLPALGIKSSYTGPQTLRSTMTGAYFQDNWKVSRTLTVNLGLRYEYSSPPVDPTNRMATFDFATGATAQVGTNGISRSGTRPFTKGFEPRVGFAWSPLPHTVVRGGYGIYYDSGMFVVNSSLYFNPPFFTISVFFPSASGFLTLANPFATSNGFVPPAALSFVSPNFVPAYAQHWNFDLQQEVARVGTFSVAYAGSKGTHLPRSLDINQPFPGSGDIASRAPYPAYSNILMTESGGNSIYNSLQFSFDRRLTRGLSILAAYTLSKSIDDTSAFLPTQSDQNFPQDSHDYRQERALSSFDVRNRATMALVYQLPASWRYVKGIEVSSIVTAQSGQPFTPVLSSDNSNTGNSGGNFGVDRPNVLHSPNLSNPTPSEWFDTSAFAIPPAYTWGNAGRNILTGPGLATVDFSVRRTFSIRESLRLTAEAQAFNMLNRANFNLPNAQADQPLTFGRIFSAKDPRQIQAALRLTF
jgi:hypothetical protein